MKEDYIIILYNYIIIFTAFKNIFLKNPEILNICTSTADTN